MQRLNVSVTATTLKESIEQNPYYPSLYSISKTFDKFNIENIAFNTSAESLDKIQTPFITYCSRQSTGKDFVLVTNITPTQVSYLSENNKSRKISKEDFLKQWQKIVFVAEGNNQSGEKDYWKKLKAEKVKKAKQKLLYAGMGLLFGLLVYWLINSTNYAIATTSLIIIKLLGIVVTVLLLIFEIDKTNSFVKNICTAGKQTNCDAVLKSKAAKFWGMSWGEIGFFYFATTILFLVLPSISFQNKMPFLAIASTLVTPYVVFSIYYQWKVVKQWCPLCLTAQAILIMEFLWSISNFWITNISYSFLNTYQLLHTVFCIMLPIIAWFLLKPLLISFKMSQEYKAAYKRLLYNPETFNNLLKQQTSAPDGWQQLGINIGNPNAANTIIKVCNPYCGPCAEAHPLLEEIVKHNSDIMIKVIFTASNEVSDITKEPVKHLLAIAEKKNFKETEIALDEWYNSERKEYEKFAAKYPMGNELKQQEYKIDAMSKWCYEAEIAVTPTIYINGKKLPETYRISELKNIF